MANQDAPFGFRAIGGMGSSYETQGTSQYQIADNSTSAIFQGDLCMWGNSASSATDANGTAVAVGFISVAAVTEDTLNIGFSMAVSITIQPLLNQHGKTITLVQLMLQLGKQ